jgi:hypothetical protein
LKAPYFLGAFAVYVGFMLGLAVFAVWDFNDFCCFSASKHTSSHEPSGTPRVHLWNIDMIFDFVFFNNC